MTAIPIPGHTPGHTAYVVASGGSSMVIWGDTVHVPEIQVARPEVTMEFDTDPEAAGDELDQRPAAGRIELIEPRLDEARPLHARRPHQELDDVAEAGLPPFPLLAGR